MKNQNKYSIGLAAIAMLLATSSCEGFLDKMPDNRTELDNSEKVLQLLVSAYPIRMAKDRNFCNKFPYRALIRYSQYTVIPSTTKSYTVLTSIWISFPLKVPTR